jgi:hypothetical protein
MAKMKLMTKEIEKRIPKLYSTEKVALEEKVAVCKFFDPCGRYTYYVVEGEYEMEDGQPLDYRFFGYCVSPLGPDCDEWGYASLNEIARVRNRFGLGIERDLHFEPKKVSELIQR